MINGSNAYIPNTPSTLFASIKLTLYEPSAQSNSEDVDTEKQAVAAISQQHLELTEDEAVSVSSQTQKDTFGEAAFVTMSDDGPVHQLDSETDRSEEKHDLILVKSVYDGVRHVPNRPNAPKMRAESLLEDSYVDEAMSPEFRIYMRKDSPQITVKNSFSGRMSLDERADSQVHIDEIEARLQSLYQISGSSAHLAKRLAAEAIEGVRTAFEAGQNVEFEANLSQRKVTSYDRLWEGADIFSVTKQEALVFVSNSHIKLTMDGATGEFDMSLDYDEAFYLETVIVKDDRHKNVLDALAATGTVTPDLTQLFSQAAFANDLNSGLNVDLLLPVEQDEDTDQEAPDDPGKFDEGDEELNYANYRTSMIPLVNEEVLSAAARSPFGLTLRESVSDGGTRAFSHSAQLTLSGPDPELKPRTGFSAQSSHRATQTYAAINRQA